VKYQIGTSKILGLVCDNCNTNIAAAAFLKPLLPFGQRYPCWSHVCNNAGKKFNAPRLDEFFVLFVALFSMSAKMRVAWKTRFGKFPKGYNNIRWYCKHDCLLEAYENVWIDNLFAFLRSPDVAGLKDNVTVDKMLNWLGDDANRKWFHFMAEIAVFLDMGTHLTSTCYYLEGDGPLILFAYDKLSALEVNLRSQFATTGTRCQALLQRFPDESALLSAQMRLSLEPVHSYIVKRIMGNGKFVYAMDVMKGARYWNPSRLVELHRAGEQSQASITNIMKEVSHIPFITPATRALLLNEFSSYYAAARDYVASDPPDPTPFFGSLANRNSFPTWCAEFEKVVLLQTSEGTVERCFSDFGNVQGSSQESRLEETYCGAVCARYNARDSY
jgi:hypothetical protein